MSAISRLSVSICFYGDELIPEEISASLRATPTWAHEKGDIKTLKSGRPVIMRTGAWGLRGGARSPGDLNAQIHELLAAVTQELGVWRDVSQRYEGVISCGLFMDNTNEGESLNPEVLLALGQRGLSLDFDIYGPFTDDDEASSRSTTLSDAED